ncbi:hypothetical protein [Cytobacillus sp. S13-E01]|uniref:hypothetical protein n=1 Tax=Cytobacillus sp. S13-E01 TaxID=3031326 RepID=UPI0023D7FB89|nr:hypothetical protein [Cytobacillus sp. S13-E01]
MIEKANSSKESKDLLISEESAGRFCELTEQAKKIDKELKDLKNSINMYFDEKVGANQKGEIVIGEYKITRQIRISENFDDEKTVQKLEKLKLNDCIEYIKKPDSKKIEAVITLGLLDKKELEGCVTQKTTQAIIVKAK